MFSTPRARCDRRYRLLATAVLPAALLLALLGLLSRPARAGGIIYVDAAAAGAATGLSWTDAYTSVQDALAAGGSGSQVWVARGVYYPDKGGGQPDDVLTVTFTLMNGVALYGGFDGTETDLDQRDPAVHVTVLSGDIDQNDMTDPHGVVTDTAHIMGANAYHVVTGGGTDSSAVLDGFTITAGQANGSPSPRNRGGGMYNDGSSPTLTGVTFSGNDAGSGGGGMANTNGSQPDLTGVTFSGNAAFVGGGLYNTNGSSPTLVDVTFRGNSAGSAGGGMSNNAVSTPVLTGVTFIDNHAGVNGGGMANNLSSPTLTGVTFSGNSAPANGGGMFNSHSSPTLTGVTFFGNSAGAGGGMNLADNSRAGLAGVVFGGNLANHGGGLRGLNSTLVLTNVVFSGNSANFDGGGMANANTAATLTNVTFSGNHAANNGGGMANSQSNPTAVNVIMWGDMAPTGPELYNFASAPGITYSDIQGCGGSGSWDASCGTDNGHNIDADPLLVDPDGADDTPGTPDDDLRPGAGSAAVDAGDNGSCPPADLSGRPRPIDGDGDNQADCDMGAFEYQVATATTILADDPDPSAPGEPFTMTVVVTATVGAPTGRVTVTVGGVPAACSGLLHGGAASCPLTLTVPGTYTLTAVYAGAGAFLPSSGMEGHTVAAGRWQAYMPAIRRDT